jgi:hypothetical protein
VRREHAWSLLAFIAGLSEAGFWQPRAPEKVGRSSDEIEAERVRKRTERAVRKWEKIERGRIKREARERGLDAQRTAYRLPVENGPARLLKDGEEVGAFSDALDALKALHRLQPRSVLWATNFDGYRIEEVSDGRAR